MREQSKDYTKKKRRFETNEGKDTSTGRRHYMRCCQTHPSTWNPIPCTNRINKVTRVARIMDLRFVNFGVDVRSFVRPCIRLFVCSSLARLLPRSLIRSIVQSFVCSFVPSFLRSFLRSFSRSFVACITAQRVVTVKRQPSEALIVESIEVEPRQSFCNSSIGTLGDRILERIE